MVDYLNPQILRRFAYIGLIIAVVASPVGAMRHPSEYGQYDCYVIAQEFANEFGGDIFYVQNKTLSPNDGIWGHAINKIKIHDNIWYIDYGQQRIYKDRDEFLVSYKHRNNYTDLIIYDNLLGRGV